MPNTDYNYFVVGEENLLLWIAEGSLFLIKISLTGKSALNERSDPFRLIMIQIIMQGIELSDLVKLRIK